MDVQNLLMLLMTLTIMKFNLRACAKAAYGLTSLAHSLLVIIT